MPLIAIAWASLARSLARLQRLVLLPGSRRRASQPAAATSPSALHTTAGRGQVQWPARALPGRPLRVLRVVDAAQGPASAGRMVISGRLADVCAELDRLAALEAAAA